MIYFYARVSAKDQRLDRQLAAAREKIGFQEIFQKTKKGLVTVNEACRKLGISRTQWYRMEKKSRTPPIFGRTGDALLGQHSKRAPIHGLYHALKEISRKDLRHDAQRKTKGHWNKRYTYVHGATKADKLGATSGKAE